MKINLGKALNSVVSTVKKNPQTVLIIGTLLAPKLAARIAPVIIAATAKNQPE